MAIIGNMLIAAGLFAVMFVGIGIAATLADRGGKE